MWHLLSRCSLLLLLPPQLQKGEQVSGGLGSGRDQRPCCSGLPSHAGQCWPSPGLEEQGSAHGCDSQAQGWKMEARLARPGLCNPEGFHTPPLEPHSLEPGDRNLCVS